MLLRTHLNACDRKEKYIALSYTWWPSSNQPSSHDAYLVQARDRSFQGSQVRDQVFDRVIAYVNYRKATTTSVRGFWIDQECIDQVNEAEKHRVIQSMEYVYIQIAFPVALLSARIKSEGHLRDLIYTFGDEIHRGTREKAGSPAFLTFQIISHLIRGEKEAGYFRKTIARQQECAF